MTDTAFGFRIIGPCTGERRLVDWHRAFAAYCAADARAGVEREAYLSAFTFGDEFRQYLHSTGSTKGYGGPCGASWLWFDLDRDKTSGGLEAALGDARTLCIQLGDRFAVSDDDLLCFYSGSKGFHVGLPLTGFAPEPGLMFHRIARRFAEHVADTAGVVIDTGVYDRVRAFRAPNSKHSKTGRHKRRLTVDELLHISADRIVELATEPKPFDVADLGAGRCGFELPAAWNQAADRLCFVRPSFDLGNVAAVADEFDASLLVLDYIQRIAPPGEHEHDRGRVNRTMDYLRQFADAGVAVIVVSAVGRTKDSRGRSSYAGEGLNLASFRESSELEFGADDAFILHPDTDDAEGDLMALKHLKSRHGECRTLSLRFDRAHQSFTVESSADGAAVAPVERGKLGLALAEMWKRTPAADEGGDDDK